MNKQKTHKMEHYSAIKRRKYICYNINEHGKHECYMKKDRHKSPHLQEIFWTGEYTETESRWAAVRGWGARGGRVGSECSWVWRFCEEWRCSRTGWWWWLHNLVNVLKPLELYILNCIVNCMINESYPISCCKRLALSHITYSSDERTHSDP